MNDSSLKQADLDSVPEDRAVRQQLLPTNVTAMLIFVAAELMFFAALISAYLIVSAGFTDWPPPDQPRLPALTTAFNSLALLASGFVIFRANRAAASDGHCLLDVLKANIAQARAQTMSRLS